MAAARDVAQYLIGQCGPLTSMKLQKLVYYSQAWSVVWDDDVIFNEPIEAWKNGPVVRDLWEACRGDFRVYAVPDGNAGALNDTQRETVDRVVAAYGHRDAQWLSDLTHMEDPWKNAYEQGQNTEIRPEALSEYYSSLGPEDALLEIAAIAV
jgi:uncharacterized phage-associated protein